MRGSFRFSIPAALFLADRRMGACGSVVAAVLEGTRPLCVEVQSLVASTPAPMPRRVAQSFDGGRLAMLVAILQRRAGLDLAGQDVYASVAGGVRVAEPGADLAVALAIAGARDDVPVAADAVVIGELGLGGEVRQVPQIGRRLAEAQRLGFTQAIVPESTPDVAGIRLFRVGDLEQRALRGWTLQRGAQRVAAGRRTPIRLLPSGHHPTRRRPWRSPDRNLSTARCAWSRRAHRFEKASTASCRRRWAH